MLIFTCKPASSLLLRENFFWISIAAARAILLAGNGHDSITDFFTHAGRVFRISKKPVLH